jgi:1-acyl-sn-glycerol-3-phosphate acyltransferase
VSKAAKLVSAFQRRSFPWRAPTWPARVEMPPPQQRLGINYDTSWARSYPARLVRAALLDWVSRPAIRLLAPPSVAGLDRIASLRTPAVFAPNHVSHLDTVVLLTALPESVRHRTVVAAGADYFFDKAWKAHLWSLATAAIPIERTRVNRQSADLAAGLLEEGWNLVIYPEGGRSPDGWAQPFRGGAAYLSRRTGAPVVPVHISGTRQVLPKNARKLTHSATTVRFGRPMHPETDEDARRFASRIEEAVAYLADESATDYWSARQRLARKETPSMRGPDAPPWRRAWEIERRRAKDGQKR